MEGRRRFVMIISMRESKMDKEIAFFFLFVHRCELLLLFDTSDSL